MAIIDCDSGMLTLQIVYDGAPCSGKTASVRALGKLLEQQVVTPEEESERTLFFDWLAYKGGLCLGRPIQCRVISVPGQPELARRRRALLNAADVVVFVADSSPEGFAQTPRHLKSLRQQLSTREREIPVLLQLNKRDKEDALGTMEMLDRLDRDHFQHHVETIATDGAGIREAFVFAVSAAIRKLKESGVLYKRFLQNFDTQQLHPKSPDQLLKTLQELDPNSPSLRFLPPT